MTDNVLNPCTCGHPRGYHTPTGGCLGPYRGLHHHTLCTCPTYTAHCTCGRCEPTEAP